MRVEAEAAALTSPMAMAPDVQAFGGQFITSNTAEAGTATWQFTISVSDDYVIWCRVKASDAGQDSVFVKADGGPEDIYDVAEGTWSPDWQWTRVNGRGSSGIPLAINPRVFPLSAGSHSIVFREREALTRVDRVIVTNELNFVPVEGNVSSFTDVPPPTPSSTSSRTWRETRSRADAAAACTAPRPRSLGRRWP